MGKTLLVTINNYTLPDVKSVRTLQNVDWEGVECLIFHSSTEIEVELTQSLTKLGKDVKKVIYINKDINPLYYCLFAGLDADIYNTEDYLQDETVVNYLVSHYKETGMALKPADDAMDTLAKAIATLSTSNTDSVQKLLTNPFWIKTLNTAVSNVDTALSRSNQINIDIVELLTESTKLMDNLEYGQENTSREIEKLKKLLVNMDNEPKSNSPFLFSSYAVPVSVSRVLYIRSYSPCRYLNSFILAYQDYLKMHKQKTVKVLFILPKLKLNIQRYKEVPRLDQESIDMVNLAAHEVFISYEPKKAVLDAFFGQGSVNVYIVIDLMYGEKLLDGHMVRTLSAVSGGTDIKRFGLNPKKVFMPIVGVPGATVIKYIPNYINANPVTRKNMYYTVSKESFATLDKELFIEGR